MSDAHGNLSKTDPDEQLQHIYALIEDLDYEFECYVAATNLVIQARHLSAMQDRISDLKTYHPGYDYSSGTMPWQREED